MEAKQIQLIALSNIKWNIQAGFNMGTKSFLFVDFITTPRERSLSIQFSQR